MAREVIVGIVVRAKDMASATFSGIAGAVRDNMNGLNMIADRVRKSFGLTSDAVRLLNNAMQVGERIYRIASSALQATIGRALEFRYANDEGRRSIEGFGRELDALAARAGDLFIPALAGISKALTSVSQNTRKWGEENEQILSSDVTQFVIDLSQTLVVGLAAAAELVSKTINGISIAWNEATAAAAKFQAFQFRLTGALSPAKGLEEHYERLALKMESQAEQANKRADAARKSWDSEVASIEKFQQALSDALEKGRKFASEYTRGMQRASQATKDLEENIEKLGDEWIDTVERFMAEKASLTEALGDDWIQGVESHLKKKRQDWADYTDAIKDDLDDFDRKQDTINKNARDDARDTAKDYYRSWASGVMSVQNLFVSSFSDIDGRMKTFGQGLKQFMLGLSQLIAQKAQEFAISKAIEAAAERAAATQKIQANAAAGASSAAAAHAGIPFVGVALAIAAAATMFSLILAYAGKFHSGGIVPGRPGEEKLALVRSREVILTEQQAASVGLGPSANTGARAAATMGGGAPTVVRVETAFPSRVTMDRTNRRQIQTSNRRGRRLGWAD